MTKNKDYVREPRFQNCLNKEIANENCFFFETSKPVWQMDKLCRLGLKTWIFCTFLRSHWMKCREKYFLRPSSELSSVHTRAFLKKFMFKRMYLNDLNFAKIQNIWKCCFEKVNAGTFARRLRLCSNRLRPLDSA